MASLLSRRRVLKEGLPELGSALCILLAGVCWARSSSSLSSAKLPKSTRQAKVEKTPTARTERSALAEGGGLAILELASTFIPTAELVQGQLQDQIRSG